MTVPSGAASLSDINSTFGGGFSLGSYYNQRWFGTNNSRGFIQASGPISISDFRGRRATSPVSAGSATYFSSQNIPIPMFNNLTVTVVSGQGGQGGFNGNCAAGGSGQPGGATALSGYVGTAQGSGGAPGGGGGSQVSASTSLSINDSNQNDIIARYGTAPFGAVGGGGGGGTTGYNLRSQQVCNRYDWVRVGQFNFYTCVSSFTATFCDIAVGGGGSGAGGYIRLDWN